MMEKLLEKKWFSRDNLLLLVLLGVLLFVIALPVKKEDSGKGQEKENAAAMLEELTASTQKVTAGSTEEYAAYLEEKLKKMLEAVRGLGEVEVMVTLESSEEKIVEKDMTAERSNTEEQDAAGGARTVNTSNTEYRTIYREDTGGDPFVVKTITPKVEGVLVVAEGAIWPVRSRRSSRHCSEWKRTGSRCWKNKERETYPAKGVHTIEYKIKKADTGLWKRGTQ